MKMKKANKNPHARVVKLSEHRGAEWDIPFGYAKAGKEKTGEMP